MIIKLGVWRKRFQTYLTLPSAGLDTRNIPLPGSHSCALPHDFHELTLFPWIWPGDFCSLRRAFHNGIERLRVLARTDCQVPKTVRNPRYPYQSRSLSSTIKVLVSFCELEAVHTGIWDGGDPWHIFLLLWCLTFGHWDGVGVPSWDEKCDRCWDWLLLCEWTTKGLCPDPE